MKNQQEIDKYLDEMIDKAERDIDVVFAKRLKALQDHIAGMYLKYSEDGALSRTQIYKYNRFQKEMQFIAEQIHEDYKGLYRDIQKLLQEQYLDNLLMSGMLYEFAAQTEMEYTIPSVSTINQAILNPIAELTLSALMNTHRNEIIRKINIEIGQAIQAGEDYATLAERLEKVVGFSRTKAKRVARTEAHRVQATARMNSAKYAAKYAKMTKMWDATLGDGKVRKSHRELDGVVIEMDELFEGDYGKGLAPGLMSHPADQINCRCSCLYLVNGKKPELRRTRLENGKTAVVPYQTYNEWVKKLPKD